MVVRNHLLILVLKEKTDDKPFFVTQYNRRVYLDPDDNEVVAPVPQTVKATGYFGVNLQACVGYMKGAMMTSYSQIQGLLENLGIPASRGYLNKICTRKISSALDAPYADALAAIRTEPIVGSDETGIKDNGDLHWAWCLRAADFTIFHIDKCRGAKVLFDILGESFAGVMLVDYFSSNRSSVRKSMASGQYCWAHLIRDIQFIADTYTGNIRTWADILLGTARSLFDTFHRRHEMTRRGYLREMNRWKKEFLREVRRPPDIKEARIICNRFDASGAEDYFRFIDMPGLEPTNNRTEQKIRHVAMDRRVTQGTRSENGKRWCEKIWSVVTSCKQQGSSSFVFLKKALSAQIYCTTTPSLVK